MRSHLNCSHHSPRLAKTSLFFAAILCTGTLFPLAAQAQASQSAPPQVSQPTPPSDLIRSLIVMGHEQGQVTPAEQALHDREDLLRHAAAVELHAGEYAQAEAGARQVLALGDISGVTHEILARALDEQGKTQEALQEYGMMASKGGTFPRNLLPYALLLLKTGQWSQAVEAYDKALPTAVQLKSVQKKDGLRLLRAGTQFSPDAPDQVGLATAIHIGLGVTYDRMSDWAYESQDDLALTEYRKALELMPDSALANYFYGYGLGELGLVQQSVAAYRKASDLATGDVKTAVDEKLKK